MIITPLGKIKIFINGNEKILKVTQLTKSEKNFIVDGRKQVLLENIKEGTVVECVLCFDSESKITSIIELGEDLASISFYNNNIKLSIGVIGDRQGI